MAQISSEEERLLLKLYNLRGDESTIITDIRNKKNNIGQMIEDVKTEKDRTEAKREELEKTLGEFSSQSGKFLEVFGGLDDQSFPALTAIGISVPIDSMKADLEVKGKEYEESLRTGIQDAKDKNSELFGQISMYGADLEAAEEELQKALSDRDALNSLLEQSLSGTESDALSKQYIRSILSNFGCFTEEEITELCKVILFPEDVLLEFDRTYDEREDKSYSDTPIVEEEVPVETPAAEVVVEEEVPVEEVTPATEVVVEVPADAPAEEPAEEETPVEEITVVEEEAPAEEAPADEISEIVAQAFAPTDEETPSDVADIDEAPTTIIDMAAINNALSEDEKRTTKAAEAKNEAEEKLEEIGLDLSRFGDNKENALAALKEADPNAIKNNFELLRSINADEAAYSFNNGYLYLTDPELSEKITLLREVKISEKKIKELIVSGDKTLTQPAQALKHAIELLGEITETITDSDIDYISRDVEQLANNIKLARKSFELDEKEERNFKGILFSPYFEKDLKILKEYLISIVKQENGRYALNVFTNKPLDLLEGIDALIEQGLEGLVTSTPEVLGQNIELALSRALFLKGKGVELYDEDNDAFIPEIVDYREFARSYGNEELPALRPTKEVNAGLANIIGNEAFTQILVDALNEYYSNPEVNPEVELDGEDKDKYEELLATFESTLNATKAGNLTYQVADVNISRNKLERNIKLLLSILSNQGQSIDGIEKEVMLVSALYNLRAPEETLRKVVDTCLGFNQKDTVGGPEL